ncbi:M12 family metallopeptidase [Dyadobacter fermentans]|uniref:M12 family metallopeptidase n=1 Tax=Dyadobacter fermentans TaxID=94254 RepID=UPI001CBD4388|nr:M12 family metallopeptidase [Dyadobacter fermentans]MBZ1357187.1 M12 family metallopeptidase [Dyadobacter fermentans]
MNINHLPNWAIGLLLAISFLTSCKKDFDDTAPGQQVAVAKLDTGSHGILEGIVLKKGIVKEGRFRGKAVTYEEIDGKAFFQGDILLTAEDLAPADTSKDDKNARVKGAGTGNKDYRWLDFKIPYEIGPGLNNTAITSAIAGWESRTPIRFVVRTNEVDYIRFEASTSNSSPVGRQGNGKQIIELASINSVGIIMHEIGHAIGLRHEQTRPDRNQFIVYNPQNVQPGKEHNFKIYDDTFGLGPFDFNSIMLYSSFDFAKTHPDGSVKPVLTRKDATNSTWTAQRTQLSDGDVATVLSLYSNIYVVQNNNLYSVSPEGGQYWTNLGAGWAGASKTIAEDDRYIWLIYKGKLWRTDRFSGNYQKMGNGDWTGAVGITGKDPQGNMYAQAGDHLWKIFPNGNFTHLPIPGGGTWKGTQALYYLNGSLWVIWKNGHIFKVNTTTGSYKEMVGGWGDVKGMTGVRRSATNLYIINGSDLYKFDTNTGQRTFLKTGYFNTTAMTGVGGRLYIASDGWLHKTDENGNKIWAERGYSGVTSMGATHFSGLFD